MRKTFAIAPAMALIAAALVLTPSLAQTSGPNPGQAQIETDFLSGMVPHHRSAVAMAQMALDKATHQELKDMAHSIIDDQNREIDQMTQRLHDWYGVEPPQGMVMPMAGMQGMMPMMHDQMPDMAAGMQDLQTKSGAEFETAFLSDMSHHHAMAIMMGLCERLLVLDMGELIAVGPPADIQADQRVLEAYFGSGSAAPIADFGVRNEDPNPSGNVVLDKQ